jgi:pyruvate,water dikinase
MTTNNRSINLLVYELQERAKELTCLYKIEELLNNPDLSIEDAFSKIIEAIPPGWQFPDITEAKLTYNEKSYRTKKFMNTPWLLEENIKVQDKIVGKISVCYITEKPYIDFGPFLKEEQKLLRTIADRLGHYILHRNLQTIFKKIHGGGAEGTEFGGDWRIVLDMIRKTDPNLFMSLLRKLHNVLCWKGIEEAEDLMKSSSILEMNLESGNELDENKPLKKTKILNYDDYINTIIRLTNKFLSYDEVLAKIQKWMQEDKSSELVKVVETQGTSLTEIAEAIRKYFHIAPEKFELTLQTAKGLRVSLLRRFFSDDLTFISVAKEYVKLTDFYNLIDRMIFPPGSHGKLGGKSSGMFLASNILQKDEQNAEMFKDIKIPKTWYMTSDGVLAFMHYNNLEEALEQKYKSLAEVKLEYPHIVQSFKNSQLPPDLIKGLSVALDDLGDRPLIVRSSSLLEDQMGAAFSGKYKSLFLANQGTKQERLSALMDAVTEVYASTFGPDPIEYRAERGLLDYHEEMGIMIQEVVGRQIGKYFLPSYAGVAFSNNEFRWSPRIKRDDGLVRIVAGLGTRAVDRVGDDYPILIAPGQPNLRVNVTIDETIRYSQKKIDVIDLETNEFKTVDFDKIIKKFGHLFKGINHIASTFDGNMLRPVGFNTEFEEEDFYITFEGLLTNTNFIKKLRTMLTTLEDKMKCPVDIEFASDGESLYLLQCRPQSHSEQNEPDLIPKNLPKDQVLFSAKKYVSNGQVPKLSHIVYVDPEKYAMLPDKKTMQNVGIAIGKLNKLLPKRKFVLMGPGRWGSRGDIKLGVSVTYSDINNTAMLIEIARTKGKYVPDLSFGTHFFQDLVESSIRYLPLYPDDEGIVFNDRFFQISENIFPYLLPEFANLADTIKVIDIPHSTAGLFVKILTNAELDEAVAILTSDEKFKSDDSKKIGYGSNFSSHQWKWRMDMAKKIAAEIDAKKYGIKGMYIFGSTKERTAGQGSDIDLLIHDDGDSNKREQVNLWLDGWSQCLCEMNYLRTGYACSGLLDLHFVTDDDIKNHSSWAIKIDSLDDQAEKLDLKNI